MNLFYGSRSLYAPEVLRGGQALADLAMIGIVQYGQGLGLVDSAEKHIKKALTERSVIERGKGFPAEHGDMSRDQAFEHLCGYAEATGRALTSTARGLIDRTLDPEEILAQPTAAGRPRREESAGTRCSEPRSASSGGHRPAVASARLLFVGLGLRFEEPAPHRAGGLLLGAGGQHARLAGRAHFGPDDAGGVAVDAVAAGAQVRGAVQDDDIGRIARTRRREGDFDRATCGFIGTLVGRVRS
ncbi:MAG TPA: ANTAR domain-containing protein [Actinocrinis sp.]|nr:ANTAR domain-containing protein [Actinocrinis sp.]